MACYRPLSAWRTAQGEVVFVERGDIVATLSIACGRCVGCQIELARQWTVRVMHEASLHDENCFVTLTYNEENCPSDMSLQYHHFQRFMRNLRKHIAPKGVRFYMCGEYGDDFSRPHYHAILFGVNFSGDRYEFKSTGSKEIVYRSPFLESLWTYGNSSIGDCNDRTANYVARYTLKKIYGDAADTHYRTIDRDTGEVTYRVPEFTHMSLKPGIGAHWFAKFHSDCYPHDRVIVKGVKNKPPRYYDKLFKKMDAEELEFIKESRGREARIRFPDNTPERLIVRETVAKAKLSFLRRKLK
ncbi:MAG: replication initiator protein [Microvirus sp.]|nr:MAG: replication initiator protein [Microvirus sp.]